MSTTRNTPPAQWPSHREVLEQLQYLDISGSWPVDYLADLYQQHQDVAERLYREAETVKDVATGVQRKLAEGYSINGLGELQGRAADFDRLCSQHYDTAGAIMRAIGHLVQPDNDGGYSSDEIKDVRQQVRAIMFGGAS